MPALPGCSAQYAPLVTLDIGCRALPCTDLAVKLDAAEWKLHWRTRVQVPERRALDAGTTRSVGRFGTAASGDSHAVLGLTAFHKGRIAVYGDSNCLDSSHMRTPCFRLLSKLLTYTNTVGSLHPACRRNAWVIQVVAASPMPYVQCCFYI